MSTENKAQNEDLSKSIDALLDEVFSETVEKGSPLDLAQDSKTTADAAVNQAPAMQDDASRGAGRPKQISDVPKNDQDGKREGQYDGSIAQAHGEEENEEAKKQSKSIDQTSSAGHMSGKPSAPKVAPFKKSEISEEEMAEFEAFKKSKAEAAEKAKQAEDLRKAESSKKEQEDLVKSEIAKATSTLRKENEELRKSFQETQALIKAMASQPQRAKSITSVEALEKSEDPSTKGSETFSKSEILDVAFELAKSGKIPAEAVSELEMTGRINDAAVRAKIEKQLEGK